FPRLKTGEPAQGLGRRTSGAGIPRLKSSTGPGREPGLGDGQAGQGNQAGRAQRLANGDHLPKQQPGRGVQDLPGGNPRGANANPQNAQDALGRDDDLFPEAEKLGGIENQDLDLNPPGPRNQDGLNNGNPQDNENPPNNAAGNPGNPQGRNPNQAPPNGNPPNGGLDNQAAGDAQPGRNGVNRNNNDALPAPRPRESRPIEQDDIASRTESEASGFARVVGTLFHVMAWMILAIICGLIVWLIGKAILEFERPASLIPAGSNVGSALDLTPSRAPGELSADVYVTQAMKFAEQGMFREAVAQLLMGAMSRVERAGWVRFKQGMTVRDYLRSIHQHPSAYQGMRSIIRVFEPLTFGRRPPTQEHFDRSLAGYESGFGSN
ncbi:MAG: DUF4129 domain-containing protein, partial [Planctomycetaceae bacterium]|nr:DUF4129 domain-containing protein [Planctomycetaceae bacterium]